MRTTHLFSSLFALTTALALTSGCDTEVEAGRDPAVFFRPFTCSWCTTIGNSPIVNGASVSDVSLVGPNSSGIKVVGIQDSHLDYYTLAIDPDTEGFMGIDLNDESRTLRGSDLVDSKVHLQMSNGGVVVLNITEVDESVASWSNSGHDVVAYKAIYYNQNVAMSLCPSANPENQWFTLIADELYDPVTHQITQVDNAFTIACVGEAAAKLKLLDYHPRGTIQSSPEQRQATLRMITADYCGDGTSFTVAGKHVAWRNASGTVEPPYAENVLEAKWGPEGAICLDNPREVSLADVLDHCEIPSCEGKDFDGAEWRTMLPGDADADA